MKSSLCGRCSGQDLAMHHGWRRFATHLAFTLKAPRVRVAAVDRATEPRGHASELKALNSAEVRPHAPFRAISPCSALRLGEIARQVKCVVSAALFYASLEPGVVSGPQRRNLDRHADRYLPASVTFLLFIEFLLPLSVFELNSVASKIRAAYVMFLTNSVDQPVVRKQALLRVVSSHPKRQPDHPQVANIKNVQIQQTSGECGRVTLSLALCRALFRRLARVLDVYEPVQGIKPERRSKRYGDSG